MWLNKLPKETRFSTITHECSFDGGQANILKISIKMQIFWIYKYFLVFLLALGDTIWQQNSEEIIHALYCSIILCASARTTSATRTSPLQGDSVPCKGTSATRALSLFQPPFSPPSSVPWLRSTSAFDRHERYDDPVITAKTAYIVFY